MSRECYNYKPQSFPDTKRKRKQTKPNKRKSNKRTKSTKISSLFPERGTRNAKRIKKRQERNSTRQNLTQIDMNKVDIQKGKLGIFRRTAMDPNKYSVIRRTWKVSITWYASFVDHAYQPKQKLEKKQTQINVQALENKIEGNDQESIQVPNTFHSKTPKGKKGAPKVTASQSKHYKQKAKRTVSSQKWPNGYPK